MRKALNFLIKIMKDSLSLLVFYFLSFNLFSQDSVAIKVEKNQLDTLWLQTQEQQELEKKEKRIVFLKSLESISSDSVIDINVNGLGFKKLPDLKRFTRITSIEAENNKLRHIKKSAFQSDSLKRIDLSGNDLKHIRFPKNMAVLGLVLNENQFRRIPRSVRKLENLEYIEISDNKLKKIPRFLSKMQSLVSLDLNYNNLRFTPNDVYTLQHIRILLMGANQLVSLPENFGDLTNLQKLNLGKNQISELPGSFANLTNLTNLIFYQNEFNEFPSQLFSLENLVELDMYYNHIHEIPPTIGRLKKLKQLFLSFNEIKILPDSIQNLTNLKYLYLHHNQLTIVPEWITSLSNIERLDLSYNRLIFLPDLSSMTALSELNIQDNLIEYFPWSLLEKPGMKILVVRNNNFILTPDDEKLLNSWKTGLNNDGVTIVF